MFQIVSQHKIKKKMCLWFTIFGQFLIRAFWAFFVWNIGKTPNEIYLCCETYLPTENYVKCFFLLLQLSNIHIFRYSCFRPSHFLLLSTNPICVYCFLQSVSVARTYTANAHAYPPLDDCDKIFNAWLSRPHLV